MVSNYIKKGGHGGKRVGAGLKAGHWDEQGGRKAAAEAKEQRKAAAQARQKANAVAAKARWSAMCTNATKQQKSSQDKS